MLCNYKALFYLDWYSKALYTDSHSHKYIWFSFVIMVLNLPDWYENNRLGLYHWHLIWCMSNTLLSCQLKHMCPCDATVSTEAHCSGWHWKTCNAEHVQHCRLKPDHWAPTPPHTECCICMCACISVCVQIHPNPNRRYEVTWSEVTMCIRQACMQKYR